jgi:hypothetical protein
VNLEQNTFFDIQTDRGCLHVDGSPHVIRLRRTTLWHSDAGARPPHQKPTPRWPPVLTKNGNLIDSFYNASASATSLRPRRWPSTTIATPLPAMRAMPLKARAFGNSPQMTEPDTTPHNAKQ